MLINLESFTKEEHSSALERFLHHPISLPFTEVILASSTPITEEHTKLLDHLSEPSSQLIHHLSHPPEEDVLAEVVTAYFICVRVHGFASCIPTFCKKGLCHLNCRETVSEVNSFQTLVSSQLSSADYALAYYNEMAHFLSSCPILAK